MVLIGNIEHSRRPWHEMKGMMKMKVPPSKITRKIVFEESKQSLGKLFEAKALYAGKSLRSFGCKNIEL